MIHKENAVSIKGTKHSTVPPLERAAEVHNHKYDYSHSVVTTMASKVDVVCPSHGIFQVALKDHLYRKTGCPSCKVARMLSSRSGTFAGWDTQKFVTRAQEVHGDLYDYTDTVYVNAHTAVEIACPTHGVWTAHSPSEHLQRSRHQRRE
jgi:hypothetical protein